MEEDYLPQTTEDDAPSNTSQAKELLQEEIKRRAKEKIKQEVEKKVAQSIISNPYVLLITLAVVVVLAIIALVVGYFLNHSEDGQAYGNTLTNCGGTVIVIDPGHPSEQDDSTTQADYDRDERLGLGATGGSGHGVVEREINQQVANVLKTELESRGYKALVTKTDANEFMSNRERGVFARDNKANLYIRLHNDDGPGSPHGAVFYYPDKNKYQQTNKNELGEMFNMIEDKTIEEEINFASALDASFKDKGIKYSDGTAYPHQTKQIAKAFGYTYNIVTSLIEMSSLEYSKDAAFIKDPENQKKLAKAFADGIEKYKPATAGGCDVSIHEGTREELAKEVLAHANISYQGNENKNDIDPTKCGTACVQKPVLQFLLALADAGFKVEVSATISDHNTNTAGGKRSRHADGMAVDIGNDEIFLDAMKWITENMLSTSIAPKQVLCAGADEVYGVGKVVPEIDNLSVDDGKVSPGFTSKYVEDHTNHIHVGY